jgi:hypothetical protein
MKRIGRREWGDEWLSLTMLLVDEMKALGMITGDGGVEGNLLFGAT